MITSIGKLRYVETLLKFQWVILDSKGDFEKYKATGKLGHLRGPVKMQSSSRMSRKTARLLLHHVLKGQTGPKELMDVIPGLKEHQTVERTYV